jgi:Fur family ferric uptake transcriptional regulator
MAERTARDAGSNTAAALRAGGERLTPQRLLVLEAVRELPGHLTAEAIHRRVRASYPYINLATIYRALGWLKGHGLVSETDLGGGQLEYEYLGPERHHHIVCLRCGAVAEFADELVAPLATALRERHGFAPRLDHLALFGLCRRCQEEAPAAGGPARAG